MQSVITLSESTLQGLIGKFMSEKGYTNLDIVFERRYEQQPYTDAEYFTVAVVTAEDGH